MRSTGETVAVLAAALAWLALLAFPIAFALGATLPAGRLVVALGAVLVLVVVYVRTAITVARRGAPHPAPVATAVAAGIALLLPLVAGSAWFGATVFLAALLGLTLPARRALVAIAVTAGLATVQALTIDAASGPALSVPLITAVAGVVVVAVVRQAALARELAASRRAVAAAAAQDERLRRRHHRPAPAR